MIGKAFSVALLAFVANAISLNQTPRADALQEHANAAGQLAQQDAPQGTGTGTPKMQAAQNVAGQLAQQDRGRFGAAE